MTMDALLVGNDINNITQGNSWADLLDNLKSTFSVDIAFRDDKPFPLAYEEFYFKATKDKGYTEREIKTFISQQVNTIKSNQLHAQLCALNVEHILTTNYDLCFEQALGLSERQCKNTGIIKEAKFNLFRKYESRKKQIWHIHGAANHYASITLGYEHYSGYLQHMRNYVIAGTQGTYKKHKFPSLISRLRNQSVNSDSWVDLFFTHNIHILAFGLDFVETDLWWLLTFRRKAMLEKRRMIKVNNTIHYYIPEKYVEKSQSKLDLLKSVGVVIHPMPTGSSKLDSYQKTIAQLTLG
jgi:hypothetical protein